MQPFTLFIDYVANALTGERRKVPPILINALSEEEASRAAIAVADFAFPEVTQDILIRVVGDDNGRPIAEIRRPKD